MRGLDVGPELRQSIVWGMVARPDVPEGSRVVWAAIGVWGRVPSRMWIEDDYFVGLGLSGPRSPPGREIVHLYGLRQANADDDGASESRVAPAWRRRARRSRCLGE